MKNSELLVYNHREGFAPLFSFAFQEMTEQGLMQPLYPAAGPSALHPFCDEERG